MGKASKKQSDLSATDERRREREATVEAAASAERPQQYARTDSQPDGFPPGSGRAAKRSACVCATRTIFPISRPAAFPPSSSQLENQLCLRDAAGGVVRDSCGNPVLECMCGNILCGRFNPALPFFTPKGSFWTNSTSELLASTSETDRQGRTRNRCNGEGYESVALIALRHGGETIGLLQVNDRAKGRFTPEMITSWNTPPIRSPLRWRSGKVRPPCERARDDIAPCSRTC